MIVTLKNDILTVDISSFGAELQSIRNTRTAEEFLWQGDKRFWGRRSPVLFPIVGSVWESKLRVDGKEYEMSQHGFARDSEFIFLEGDDDSEAMFELRWSDDTLAIYPYRFVLQVGYRLHGERLEVIWKVINDDRKEMSFQIGAHPAFNYPDFNEKDQVHGFFNLDCAGSLSRQIIAERGCFAPEPEGLRIGADGMLPLTADTFASDALVFADGRVRRVSMLDKEYNPYLTLLFNAPVLGLWSPVSGNAPFVCIEPWWGRADAVGYDGDFSQREFMYHLLPGETFTAGYLICIDR